MSDASTQKKGGGWLKAGLVGLVGICGGAAGTYATAVVEKVVKPARPVANFSVTTDGLAVACQNHATGESGWWDFGDGTPLVPFAPDEPVTHPYLRPGNYTVKLTVRNYFGDENERSVPVEVGLGPKEATGPQITGFAVAPVGSSSVAPATFRVTAATANADGCVWDFGDGRVEAGEGGAIDRLVTFDRPGTFAVQLYAHAGKQAVRQAAAVKVSAAPVGSLMAVLKVTDTGNRVLRTPRNESVAVPVPAASGKTAAPPGFSKVIQARPGFALVEASPAAATVAGVKNLKVIVAPDRRSATVSGDWAGDPKAPGKSAGGSDVIVPVKLTEERVVPLTPAVAVVTGMTVIGGGRMELPLPPPPADVTGLVREYQIEIRQAGANGQSSVVARGPADGKGSARFPWSGRSGPYGFAAVLEGNKVVVTVTGP